MIDDRRSAHRALAKDAWGRIFDLFVGSRAPRESALQRFGLTPNDVKTLGTLDATVAKPMRALAHACCTDASNATWAVDRLESRGLVERRTVAGDRRVKLVGLTPRGVKTRNAIMDALHEPPPEMLLLGHDDLVALGRILAKIPRPADSTPPPQSDTAQAESQRLSSRALRRPRGSTKQRNY